ncbi:unnamed protein product [Rangifer tarandus platyrhynchus]|uniref:Uncharacterized protein n=2 Tax=Rangifer tarandus platyrhynchus TaxID=3082113 RepID=A0ABN8Y2K6_RANTA|nr:unnamed protein product [Rangifer tarandus platyrhynchus]CAI9693096.1 unnamed protein product [Rangifer tarandus platyrhynchus]
MALGPSSGLLPKQALLTAISQGFRAPAKPLHNRETESREEPDSKHPPSQGRKIHLTRVSSLHGAGKGWRCQEHQESSRGPAEVEGPPRLRAMPGSRCQPKNHGSSSDPLGPRPTGNGIDVCIGKANVPQAEPPPSSLRSVSPRKAEDLITAPLSSDSVRGAGGARWSGVALTASKKRSRAFPAPVWSVVV